VLYAFLSAPQALFAVGCAQTRVRDDLDWAAGGRRGAYGRAAARSGDCGGVRLCRTAHRDRRRLESSRAQHSRLAPGRPRVCPHRPTLSRAAQRYAVDGLRDRWPLQIASAVARCTSVELGAVSVIVVKKDQSVLQATVDKVGTAVEAVMHSPGRARCLHNARDVPHRDARLIHPFEGVVEQ
jgi:hypothetical protein